MTIEIMIAFSLCVLFTLSIFSLVFSMQRLKVWSVNELEKTKDASHRVMVKDFASSSIPLGNDTEMFPEDPFTFTLSIFKDGWGRTSCWPRFPDIQSVENFTYFNQGIELGASNKSTDLEVHNGFMYLTADANTSAPPDLYIVDARSPGTSTLISSLNTGPGLSALEVAGPYVFAAHSSTVSQLQIINIEDRAHPVLISSLRVPLPTPSTTPPFATSIFYKDGFIYLGTEKWAGPEFFVIDVSNISIPTVVGSFETNTLINDIYVRDDIAYLASSDSMQMRLVDVSVKSDPVLAGHFSPSGGQVQEGKIVEYFENRVGLGRTVGGFNVINNHEAFIFPTSIDMSTYFSHDIPGGVYGILLRPPFSLLLTHSLNTEFQVWDSTISTKLFDIPLGASPVKMSCDGPDFYFATGDHKGFSVLKFKE